MKTRPPNIFFSTAPVSLRQDLICPASASS